MVCYPMSYIVWEELYSMETSKDLTVYYYMYLVWEELYSMETMYFSNTGANLPTKVWEELYSMETLCIQVLPI